VQRTRFVISHDADAVLPLDETLWMSSHSPVGDMAIIPVVVRFVSGQVISEWSRTRRPSADH